jgi:hypothetical protein
MGSHLLPSAKHCFFCQVGYPSLKSESISNSRDLN